MIVPLKSHLNFMYLPSLLLSPPLHLKETFLGICAGGDCSGHQGPEACEV